MQDLGIDEAALPLTWHNPVQVPILNLLIVLILCKVELTGRQMPVQESNLLCFVSSLQIHYRTLRLNAVAP